MSQNNRQSPIWHPFTQHAIADKMTRIDHAAGAYLYTHDKEKVLDAISSWWVITHGHCYSPIVKAIQDQAQQLDQVIFAGHTHEKAEQVAKKLIEISPDGLDYVFFSDSGSTCVEVALKMALGFWQHSNTSRHKIIVMEHSYHGDTIGTMSVGERGVFNQPYSPLLFDVASIPFPEIGHQQLTLDSLESHCKHDDVAAFIVEPLVLGAGGMLMYSPQLLSQMKQICSRHDVLFIADEVMTGWGRTGTRFACEQADVIPDIACYSKGISGGSLPLAVTLCRADIFDAHYSTDRSKTFFHSSSYTANPIACAAALANLLVWENEPVQQRIDKITAYHRLKLKQFADDDRFQNIRQTGTIAALDIKVADQGYLADIGPKLYGFFQSQNLLLRPLGNTVYILPPFCTTSADLDKTYAAINQAADLIGSE